MRSDWRALLTHFSLTKSPQPFSCIFLLDAIVGHVQQPAALQHETRRYHFSSKPALSKPILLLVNLPEICLSTMSLRLAASRSIARAVNTRSKSTAAVVGGLDYEQTVDNFESVLDRFAHDRACAVLRTSTSEACPKAMQAAIDGGFKIVEFTLTTPDCLQHLSDFRSKYDGDVMVGCGTILSPEDAANAMEAGSEFIITPVMLPDVIDYGEWQTGVRHEGIYYGLFIFLQKLGVGISIALANAGLDAVGYLNPRDFGELATQPDGVLLTLRLLMQQFIISH